MTSSTDRRPRQARAALAAAAFAPLMLALGACNIVAPAAYLIEGPPTVPAQTSLDPGRPTVIFIDDRASNVPRRSLRVIAGQTAEETMIAEDVVEQENMIAAQSTLRAASTEDPDDPMSIADLGRAVGAEVVVYLTVDAWTLSSDGVSFSPVVSTRVKVVDAENRVRLWPQGGDGFSLRVEPPRRATDVPRTASERSEAENRLAARLGRAVAKLFYESERETVNDRR